MKLSLVASTLLLTITILVNCDSPLRLLITFLERGGNRLKREFPDQVKLRNEYDFIIVGAGSAGCALANRLSENPKWNVLLIEAGQSENLLMDIPMLVHYLQLYNVNWRYKTERSDKYCLGMINNQCNWPRGKVMGGSSVLNYMVYTRGNRRDYDYWAALGNDGWDYHNVSHYFRKLENNVVPFVTPNHHGRGGPVTISNINYKSSAARAFIEAGIEAGYPYVDYNGPTQIGFSYLQATIKNGERMSSNAAYLYPISSRKNLHVRKNSHVTKLLIDGNKKVYGVKFITNNRSESVRAKKEVILTAGAINTPQILMLSGIGPANHLRSLGIETIVNSAVGYNLMDHTAPGALTFTVNTTTIKGQQMFDLSNLERYTNRFEGPISSAGGVESIAFLNTENPADLYGYPDLEYLQLGGSVNSDPIFKINFGIRDEIYNEMFAHHSVENSFMVFPMVMRPKSRGRIKLQSNNPFDHPIIIPNYFSDPYDIDIAIRGIRRLIELLDTKAFRKVNAQLLKTPLRECASHTFNSYDYWECYTRHLTFTIYHHCGTAKMGPPSDKRAVVDPTLKVYGVTGLRVADASVIPQIITGHTNAPALMIGEKAADMIKSDWMYR